MSYALSIFVLSSGSAFATWSSDPAVNNVVCVAVNDQYAPQLIGDGSGGAILSWTDYRSGFPNSHIYAQRLNASGSVQWTGNGVAVCVAANYQSGSPLVSDGSGGAFIVWQDYRSGTNWDIYAQRINASGVIQWISNGIGICTAAGDQDSAQIISDGSGGVIVVWVDFRNASNYDVYAQKLNSSGSPQWTANGVAICAAAADQTYPELTTDGAGGAIITWQDLRNSGIYDIYAQHVDSGGAVQWSPNGVAICTATNAQKNPEVISDGAGGAIIAWGDARTNNTNSDIYAQRINSSGTVQWTSNGIAICAQTRHTSYLPQVTSDGAGGAVISWEDYRNFSDSDVYVQRINSSGFVQWTTNGVAICTAAGDQLADESGSRQILGDGAGGAIITWYDRRSGSNYDIYAQRINGSGIVQWVTNGVAISTATNDQKFPQLATDAAGGAIITWQDYRSGTNYHVYASHLGSSGVLPVVLADWHLE
ncbi:MAG: hypothetical protein ACR2IE_03560 [Candidatus Sumerlaeaceae bacterium]